MPTVGKSRMCLVFYSLIIGLVYLPYKTSSAPTTISSQNNGTYVKELLEYVQLNKCPFPVQTEIHNETKIYKSVSRVCYNTTKPFDNEIQISENTGVIAKCVAVADFIPKICTKAKESPEILTNSKISMSVMTEFKNAPRVSQFCRELRLIKPKTEEFKSQLISWYKDFFAENENTIAGTAHNCEIACAEGSSTGKEKDLEPTVSPVCVLLKKEFEILNAFETLSTQKEQTNDSNKNREGVSDFKQQESQHQEAAAIIPNSASPVITDTDGDKDNQGLKHPAENQQTFSSSSIKPDKQKNISPLPNIDDIQGDQPIEKEPEAQKSANKVEKVDSVDSVDRKDDPPVGKGSTSKPISSSTVSSADKNRINSEELETPPAAEKPLPSASSSGDKQSSQEQKPPVEDKPLSMNNHEKVSSSPASETVSSSNKRVSAISPQQKPSKAKNGNADDNFDAMNAYDAVGPGGEIDDGEDNTNFQQDDKFKTSSKKSNSSPNNLPEEGDGRMPLETPNNSASFSDADDSGGYFNYFIFFLTVMGLSFFAFQNKRRVSLINFKVQSKFLNIIILS